MVVLLLIYVPEFLYDGIITDLCVPELPCNVVLPIYMPELP